jgi:hypothetical protein
MSNNHPRRLCGRHAFLPVLAGLLLLGLLPACSGGLQVRSDIDPAVNFSQYTTYNYFEPMGIEGGYNSPIFGELFRASISNEMAARGYRLAANPDLLVNVTIRGDDKIEMKSYTAPYMTGGYYSRPGGPYYGSALGVGVASTRSATMVTEASLFIDIVDPDNHKLVWQGVAVFEASEDVASRLRDAVYTSVNKILAEYPHTTGN